jgi:hypothetical protein
MSSNTTASNNVAVGKSAMASQTTGGANTVIGDSALGSDTTGLYAVAVGNGALLTQNFTDSTQNYNVAVGTFAGKLITTGNQNVLVGGGAGDSLTDADNNVAIGYAALSSDTLGSSSVAIGKDALFAQNQTTAAATYNVAVGVSAGANVTTGTLNTFIGGLAGDANTTGANNTYIGYGAAGADDQSQQNVVIGSQAATLMNHGAEVGFTTIVGFQAGYYNVTGTSNTYVGYRSGFGASGNSNASNTAMGRESLYQITTGNTNSFFGHAAGIGVSSGSNNFGIGNDSGRSGSPGGAIGTSSNIGVLGDENISSLNCQVALSVASDERDKTDFVDLDLGLDFVKALEPVTYYWDKRSKYGDKYADDYDLNAQTPDGTHKEDWMDVGFKAQSVSALEEAAGYKISDKKNLTVSLSSDGKQYSLRYEKFIPMLVKAIQELSAEVEKLKSGG